MYLFALQINVRKYDNQHFVWQPVFYQFSSFADEGLKDIIGKKFNNEFEKITLDINSSWYVVGSMSRYVSRH